MIHIAFDLNIRKKMIRNVRKIDSEILKFLINFWNTFGVLVFEKMLLRGRKEEIC